MEAIYDILDRKIYSNEWGENIYSKYGHLHFTLKYDYMCAIQVQWVFLAIYQQKCMFMFIEELNRLRMDVFIIRVMYSIVTN